MDVHEDDAAWLASLDAQEPSAALLAALFSSGDTQHDVHGPTLSSLPQKTKKTMKRKTTPTANTTAPVTAVTAMRRASKTPRAELQHLRLAVADLENVRTLLLQRQQRRIRKTSSRCAEDPAVDRAWKAVASRQLQLLSAAKVENQQLRSTVVQQTRIVQHLLALVARAQRGLPSQPVARPLVPSDVVSQCAQQRTELFALVAEMRDAIDGVATDAALAHSLADEFSALSINADIELQRVIPDGVVLGSAVSARVLPQTRTAVADHLWRPAPSGRSFITMEYEEQNDTTCAMHYTISGETSLGFVRLLVVQVQVRLREPGHDPPREIVLLASAMWPDAHTPRPVNAVAYTTREWTIIEPNATRSEGQGGSRVLVKSERVRRVHGHGRTAALAADEAAALRYSVEQANTMAMEGKHRRLDELLLGRAC